MRRHNLDEEVQQQAASENVNFFINLSSFFFLFLSFFLSFFLLSFFLSFFQYQHLLIVILAIKILTTGCISLVSDSTNAIWHNVFHV